MSGVTASHPQAHGNDSKQRGRGGRPQPTLPSKASEGVGVPGPLNTWDPSLQLHTVPRASETRNLAGCLDYVHTEEAADSRPGAQCFLGAQKEARAGATMFRAPQPPGFSSGVHIQAFWPTPGLVMGLWLPELPGLIGGLFGVRFRVLWSVQ